MALFTPNIVTQFFDNNGDPLSGGYIYTYATGTSNLLSTWISPAGDIPNTNPIILDDAGKADIYLSADTEYKFVVYDRNGVLLERVEPVFGIGSTGSAASLPFISATDYGAIGNGSADDTAAIQAALNTGRSVFVKKGTYKITDTLKLTADGQVLFGEGKSSTVIENSTTSAGLLTYGIIGAAYVRRAAVRDIEFVGNATSTFGVAVLGIVDDGLTGDASKSCAGQNIRIRNVGNGWALRISSWSNTFSGIELWSNKKGLLCGSEFNGNAITGLYITGCDGEAISSPVSSGQPAANVFTMTIAQYSKGALATIDLQEAYSFTFNGLYLEGNQSPCNVLVGAGAQGTTINGVMHNLVSGTVGMQVIKNLGKSTNINSVVNLGGTVDSLVRIEGALPFTTVSNLFVSVGTATNGKLYDISTRKATVFLDTQDAQFGPMTVNSLDAAEGLTFKSVESGLVTGFYKNGALYFGPDSATAPNLSKTGSTLSVKTNGSLSPLAADILLVGASPIKILSNTGTPEGAYSANVGSLYLRTNGGAGTTLYVKESGTGNTGWVAK